MFNNVKAIYAARGDFVEALALIDGQMPLVGDHRAAASRARRVVVPAR